MKTKGIKMEEYCINNLTKELENLHTFDPAENMTELKRAMVYARSIIYDDFSNNEDIYNYINLTNNRYECMIRFVSFDEETNEFLENYFESENSIVKIRISHIIDTIIYERIISQ